MTKSDERDFDQLNSQPLPLSDAGLSILKSAMVQDIAEALATRASRRRAFLFSIAGLIIPALLIGLSYLGRLHIDNQVTDRVKIQFEELENDVLSELLFHRDLATLTLAIENLSPSSSDLHVGYVDLDQLYAQIHSDHFSHREGREMLSRLDTSKRMRQLRTTIMQVSSAKVEEFAQKGSPGQLATLIIRLRGMIQVTPGDFQIVNVALGRELLGARNGANAWTQQSGDLSGVMPAWREVISVAKNANFPELRLAFEPIRLWMQNPQDPALLGMINEIDRMREIDKRGYRQIVLELLNQSWRSSPDFYSERAQRNTLGFLKQFSCDSVMLREVLEAYEAILAQNGRQLDMPSCL